MNLTIHEISLHARFMWNIHFQRHHTFLVKAKWSRFHSLFVHEHFEIKLTTVATSTPRFVDNEHDKKMKYINKKTWIRFSNTAHRNGVRVASQKTWIMPFIDESRFRRTVVQCWILLEISQAREKIEQPHRSHEAQCYWVAKHDEVDDRFNKYKSGLSNYHVSTEVAIWTFE